MDPKRKKEIKERLLGSKFRLISERLYLAESKNAGDVFPDEECFREYHRGYQKQKEQWNVDPLKTITKELKKKDDAEMTVADIGCGEGKLAHLLRKKAKVNSFDLVSTAPHITVANMNNLPLPKKSVSAAVFCLSLMNKDYGAALDEARRVLKKRGALLVTEIESRLPQDKGSFIDEVESHGFALVKERNIDELFCYFEFARSKKPLVKKKETLKPCRYKKR
ncbi:MAG: ribosomal RNA-processing protein 8 [Amphiamblys sp. WSBS2006]|nr:MAG: ribosomal RNA-processing protein 8 [Amphiamblys sp. WSBS2006]